MAIGGYLGAGLLSKDAASRTLLAPARAMLLPGKTTHGHHQIELACETCHATPFAGREQMQEACVDCHGAELKAANDTHPLSKFTDPRNADRLEKIDATLCVTCHVEHRPAVTLAMGVTVAGDVCFHCHAEIGKDRPSHAGMAFDTCNSAGCHKFHDNRALYEDFLLKHLDTAPTAARPLLRPRAPREAMEVSMTYPAQRYPRKPLSAGAQDATASPAVLREWLETSHANNGVNCTACHGAGDAWVEHPGHAACKSCHEHEVGGFLAGKHGMRLAQNLPPMTPDRARLPMARDAHGAALDCVSCHAAHRFDTRKAAVESCLGCHVDRHSLAYERSPHAALWKKELAGVAPAGSGVSCASCHLPRVDLRLVDLGMKVTLVQHNQNETLQPNEKMIRPVCLECHGLAFSIDALADRALVQSNFTGRPSRHVPSLDMAAERQSRR